jgi:hypothetical protein
MQIACTVCDRISIYVLLIWRNLYVNDWSLSEQSDARVLIVSRNLWYSVVLTYGSVSRQVSSSLFAYNKRTCKKKIAIDMCYGRRFTIRTVVGPCISCAPHFGSWRVVAGGRLSRLLQPPTVGLNRSLEVCDRACFRHINYDVSDAWHRHRRRRCPSNAAHWARVVVIKT